MPNKKDNKFDDNILDVLINNIASDCYKRVIEAMPNASNSQRIEYLSRSFTEILIAIITSLPKDQMENLSHKICNSILGYVKIMANFPFDSSSSLKEKFEDAFKIQSSSDKDNKDDLN